MDRSAERAAFPSLRKYVIANQRCAAKCRDEGHLLWLQGCCCSNLQLHLVLTKGRQEIGRTGWARSCNITCTYEDQTQLNYLSTCPPCILPKCKFEFLSWLDKGGIFGPEFMRALRRPGTRNILLLNQNFIMRLWHGEFTAVQHVYYSSICFASEQAKQPKPRLSSKAGGLLKGWLKGIQKNPYEIPVLPSCRKMNYQNERNCSELKERWDYATCYSVCRL